MRLKYFYIIFSLLLVSITSCQKVIELDLKESEAFYVIEGSVNKDSLVHTIYISQSKNFSSDNVFTKVENAIVTLSDDINNSEVLAMVSPGVYKSSTILGEEGRTYNLNVKIGDKTFTSTSVMPSQVEFLDLLFINDEFTGGGSKIAIPSRLDPAGIYNAYKFDVQVSRFKDNAGWVRDSAIIVQDDEFSDGLYSQQPLFGSLSSFMPKDTCRVTMMCIDKNVYKYFYSLSLNDGGAATPANPISNITNGALGYFSAQSKQLLEVVVPE